MKTRDSYYTMMKKIPDTGYSRELFRQVKNTVKI